MSSATAALGRRAVPRQGAASPHHSAPRQYAVPCPACGTAARIEEGGPEADRTTCAGCGSQLVILRTDTMFMAAIPAPPRPAPACSVSGADDIAELWSALAQK